MRHLLFSLLMFISLESFSQRDTSLYKYYVYSNYDPNFIDKNDLDTIPVYITYVDSTMCPGSKTIKVGPVYKFVRYTFPCHPEVKYKTGFAIVFKYAINELSLINDYTGEYWPFTTLKYLDEVKQPFAKKYMILLTKALNYDFKLPSPSD